MNITIRAPHIGQALLFGHLIYLISKTQSYFLIVGATLRYLVQLAFHNPLVSELLQMGPNCRKWVQIPQYTSIQVSISKHK